MDFVLGAEPHTGAFVVGYNNHPVQRKYMKYFKMGDGPLYIFYTPYHLPHIQLPHSVARAVLFKDAIPSTRRQARLRHRRRSETRPQSWARCWMEWGDLPAMGSSTATKPVVATTCCLIRAVGRLPAEARCPERPADRLSRR